MTYSLDFRRKVLSVREEEGLTIPEVADRFCVGVATIVRWLQRLEPCMRRNKPATKIDRIALARDVREHPDAYQAERAQRLGVSKQGIGHALRRMGISYKKKPSAPTGERRRTAILPRKAGRL
jgi:transposase